MITELDYEIEGLPLVIIVTGYKPEQHEMIKFGVYVKANPNFELDFRIFKYWEREITEFVFDEMRKYYKDLKFESEIDKINMEDYNG